ncbi:MAG TPA: RDD family protein [Streptosporangiaceae bacterium]|nr:RDD family protein [Streptosporangiaceae bacterium]
MDDARAPNPSTPDRTGSARAAAGSGHPGEGLGLPATGSGSVAGYGRRLGALFIDWLVALVTVSLVAAVAGWRPSPGNLWPVVAFGVETWLLTALLGVTFGKRLFGLRVTRLDGAPVGPLWALVRTALLLTIVPALLWDRDYRGLHDKAADTVVVRA